MINIRSPFRLPLGGGGTDLPEYYSKFGGFLVTAAIDKYMYIAINRPALVDKIMVRYSETETVTRLEDLKHDIARNVLLLLDHHSPIHINSMADIAAGTGLGSSSAYAVGLIKGLLHLQRLYLPLKEIAEMACKVEIELCKKPIGKQDQYATTFGGLIVLTIDTKGNVEVAPLNVEEETVHDLEHRLMMFYTNIQRDANDILGEQSHKVKTNDAVVLESMHKIKAIAMEIRQALEQGDVTKFGTLMHEHWTVKKKITKTMSSNRIDKWYDIALNHGALGGKLMGAGGGGFLLLCTEPEKRKSLRTTLEKAGLRYMPFAFDMEGAKVLMNL